MQNNLGNIPFHLMRQLFQEHTSQWQKSLPDLTKQQYSVLCAVAEQPGIEQMDLMAAALSTKATLAELLMRMEKKGLILRQPGTSDKRRRLISLTPEGEQVLHEARPLAEKVDDAFLSRLTIDKQKELVRLLQEILGESPPSA